MREEKKHKEVISNQKLFSNYNRGILRQTANDKLFTNFFFQGAPFTGTYICTTTPNLAVEKQSCRTNI